MVVGAIDAGADPAAPAASTPSPIQLAGAQQARPMPTPAVQPGPTVTVRIAPLDLRRLDASSFGD
jgi:hypothetical protein